MLATQQFIIISFSIFLFPFISLVNLMKTPSQRFAQYDINHYQKSTHSECYDSDGMAQRCVPDFGNVAFNLPISVYRPEFTCGFRRPSKYCIQTGNLGILNRICSVCDNRIPHQSHPPIFLTDFHTSSNETFWQSETMEEGIHKSQVNLTLQLDKAFDITYVRLRFAAPRPESFVIYKKTRAEDQWQPWQFYSGSCRSTFGLPEKVPIIPANEAMAQCTREFSDISPLTGGDIAFSTLESRPSAVNFEESEVLQKWVTATEIMISLVRLNTYGDEIWGDPRVLRTYFYAITDFVVGGRCKCNGHANKCVKSTGQGELQKLVCDCQHNTVGVDCQECAPFYVDRPWRPATSIEANECLPCNCNGLSQRCFFDAKLFEATSHGGHCIDCIGNTEGVHCENCVPGYWRHSGEKYCRPCNCDLIGSLNSQCSPKDGRCVCKSGVGGQRCDQCLAGFYGFGENGCKKCHCDPDGTFEGQQQCSPLDGRCACKPNVEGKHCERCKPGYFLLSADNPFGCFPCFCFGHSSVCSPSDGFYARNISANFLTNIEGWKGANFENGKAKSLEIQYDPNEKAISVGQECDRFSYFLAPSKFLGDQRLAYGQFLHFSLRKLSPYGSWSSQDLQLIGANGRILSLPLGAQRNLAPSTQLQHYQFRIHADSRHQWNPQLREIDFIGILSNLSEIRLRATYSLGDVGFLSHFSIGSASEGLHPEEGIPRRHAHWVEQCECPPSFAGQFCQFCAPQNKRAHPFGGQLTKCVPCQCNGHAKSCDSESGICECAHNTAGDSCERCARGYYGDALNGTSNDCKPCGCPGEGPCLQMEDEDGLILCKECPEGYSGPRCEYCSEEYFGDPQAGRPCKKCDCNGNVDPNAIKQCDQLTGECRRCIHQTIGWNCERCRLGFWGNALAGGCNPCNCYAQGTQRTGARLDIFGGENVLECAQGDGQCTCLPNVIGKQCEKCSLGFFNISSGMGCQPCECDPLGSLNISNCDLHTGQCECKNGVIGQKCDQCAQKHFGFGISGCAECICHRHGAEFEDCDIRNGQCLCKDWVEGRQCDRCAENHYNLEAGCPPCDDCYSLIQNRKALIIGEMAKIGKQFDDFWALPIPLNDTAKFNESLQAHFSRLQRLEARKNLQEDSKLAEYYKTVKNELNATIGYLKRGKKWMFGLDRNLAEIERKLGKFGREKSTIQREINYFNIKIESTKNKLIKQEKEQQKMAGRRINAEIKLSEMAKIADDMAKKQEERKAQILEMTKEIEQKRKMSLDESKQAVYGDAENREMNSTIPFKLNQLETNANHSLQELAETLEKTKKTNEEANEVHNEMALNLKKIEKINVPREKKNPLAMLNELKNEIGGIEKELEKTMTNGREMKKNSREELEVAKVALMEAKRSMEEVEKKFEFATKMKERALEAKEKADNALENTNAILKALEDGQDAEQLENMKEQYKKEMSHFRGLAKQLAQTQRRLNKAEKELENVQNKAEKALKLSLKAEKRAKLMAKENVPGLIENVEKMQSRLNFLSKELNYLEEAIRAEEKLNADMNANELTTKIVEAHHRAVSYVKLVLDMKNTTEKNGEVLMKLLERLNSISPEVNDDELNLIEAELEKLEKAYADSGFERIEARFKQLMAEKAQFHEKIINLSEELGQLKNIAKSLPLKCFNKVNIEQNGQ